MSAISSSVIPGQPAGVSESQCLSSVRAIEQALTVDPLCSWEALLDLDPSATLFQSPVWCMAWYRNYQNFEPRLLVVSCRGVLAGVVPLAVERATGRFTFAGDNMTDYRDIMARPEYREQVVLAFLEYFKRGGFGNVLHLGPTLPESETPRVLMRLCGRAGIHAVDRVHHGWRWRPEQQQSDFFKRKSVRYPMNVLRREGELSATCLRSVEEWDAFKEDYYRQHTLRQIYGGRLVSFDNRSKRAFYDEIFRSPYGHALALRLNGRLIAGHAGFVYKKVMYWSAPSFDVRYRQYSPNLILMVLTMKNAPEWGLREIDLTMGEGYFKEQYSTMRVDLPWVELYPKALPYYLQRVKTVLTNLVKAAVIRVGGAEAWRRHIKPRFGAIAEAIEESGPGQAAWGFCRSLGARVMSWTREIALRAVAGGQLSAPPCAASGDTWLVNDNNIYDLLERPVAPDEAGRRIAKAAGEYADIIKIGGIFHTLLVNGKLGGWVYSASARAAADKMRSDDRHPEAWIEYEENSVVLFGLYIMPEFRDRKLAQTLTGEVLRRRFQQGAARAYTVVPASDRPALAVARRTGFNAVLTHQTFRFLKWSRSRTG